MAGRNQDLYRWKRWSQKDVSSASTKKKMQTSSTDDIQCWIKKVEKASDQAAAMTFGHGNSYYGDLTAHGNIAGTLDALQDHSEAHSEAQELLSNWMAQKCSTTDPDDDAELKFLEDDEDMRHYAASKESAKSDLKSQWDHMLAENDPVAMDPYSIVSSEQLFHEIETRDDNEAVQSILDGLMKKDIVESRLKKNLSAGTESEKKDPLVTMDARQKKVKANRQRREQLRHAQLMQQQQHKDAQSQAHQIVQKEERNKALQRQREEALIQQEMVKLRKEMQEQRRMAEEIKERERQLEGERLVSLKQEEERIRKEEFETKLKAEAILEEERQHMKQRLEEIRAIKASQDLKCLQQHFQAWYQLVLRRRLTLGKARAVADWRMLLRAWNAWRAYVRACQAERETRQMEEVFKDMYKKEQMAAFHYRQKLLKKCFVAWCLWLHNEHHSQELKEQKNKTKTKMAAFLDAAASGKLWTNRNEEEEVKGTQVKSKMGQREGLDRPDSMAHNLDDLFGDSTHTQSAPHSVKNDTLMADIPQPSQTQRHSAGPSKPKYAWQVMRKHVDLPLDDILSAGDEDNQSNVKHQYNRNQNNTSDNVCTQASAPSKKTIKGNCFEHRYATQQRILHEQQRQLHEQKRLIEDLQAAQQQQMLKMQLGVDSKDIGAEMNDGEGTRDHVLGTERSLPESSTAPSTARSDHSDTSSMTSSGHERQKEPARPPLLKGMKEREESRLKMKAEREERQRKKEQQKLEEIKAKELRQEEEKEAEKKAKLEKRREEKRLAKQRELEKQQRAEYMNQQIHKAQQYYQHHLLRHKGLDPWVRLLHRVKQNTQVAEDHYKIQLLRKCLLPWRESTYDVMQEKNDMADKLYDVIIVRRAFECWKRYGHRQSIQLQKARRHHTYCIKVKVFKAWQQYITDEELRKWKNEEIALDHSHKRILKVSFCAWRQYPQILKSQRLREQHIEDMRKKVASILPDFGDG